MKNANSIIKRLILLPFIFIFYNSTIAQTTVELTTPGGQNWNVPAGVTSVDVECWGAGGAGGSGANRYGGGGGGGGAYSFKANIPVTPGGTVSVQVGIGGDATVANRASYFIDLATIVANGGQDGANATGGSVGAGGAGGTWTAGNGDSGFSGGTGGNGNTPSPASGGGGGSSAGTASAGNPGGTPAGGTAVTDGGAGGAGGTNASGTAGTAPGGGGGAGGDKSTTGANGANGKIRITYTVSNNQCPSSNEIAPLATQTHCVGDISTQLTATITTSGADGTPTFSYQWYYNTLSTDGNTIATATKIAGATSQTYTPPTTASDVGDRWYFCVGYSSDNGCAQTDADQSLASSTAQVTVNALPNLVITNPAAVCSPNTVDLTAPAVTAGSDAGTSTYFTDAGLTNPIPDETAVGAGTYYIKLTDGNSCVSSGSVTVTVNPLPNLVITDPAAICSPGTVDLTAPAVTAGSDAGSFTYFTDAGLTTPIADETSVGAGTYYIKLTDGNSCASSGSVTVTVNPLPNLVITDPSAVCSPNTVDLTAPAVTAGSDAGTFTYFTDAGLTTPVADETAVGAGTYYIKLTDGNSCASSGSVTVTVNDVATTGAISGAATVVASTSGLIYNVTTVGDETNFTWTIPTGWSFESGQGTNSITVTSGSLGQDGNITVYATNTCGDDPTPSILAVTIGSPPDCPSSTSVVPSAVQTVCEDVATNQLTATINTSGGSGTPTLLYQWYYNTSNSNTVTGATKISGATSSTYTPLSTSAEAGDRWYFCVGYATDNTCGQTDADQSLASNPVQVTVNPKPSIPTAITGTANTDPNTAGYVYSTTSTNADANGYSWTVPTNWIITAGNTTNSITVTSGNDGDNGNITVTASNSCGASAQTVKAVTATAAAAPPTITLGANPTACENTLADLTYSATSDSPNLYSINYNTTAEAQGFVDVTDAALPASPIQLVVPNNIVQGIYSGNLTVKNSTSGLSSTIYEILITVNGRASSISGIATANPNTQGYEYSVSDIANATSYSWTVPTNWAITAGATTNAITVTSGNNGDNGNISVQVVYACGTSTTTTLAVTVSDVTDHVGINCSDCHTFHGATGSALTNAAAASDLCLSCHNSGSIAKDLPFLVTDQANSTGNKNSHSWDAIAVNSTFGAVLPTTYTELAERIVDGKISCATCHDQHHENPSNFYLRIDNTNDVICKDCHAPRNVGTYAADNVNNRGSHPINVAYDETDTRFVTAATSTLVTSNGENIICSTCHGVHDVGNTGALTTDGNLLKFPTNDETLCTDCHQPMSHNGMTCITCHDVHDPLKTNIYMVRSTITTPNSGDKTVVFTAETGANSFADGDATYDGVCEVCHTTTSHYRNDGLGADQSHTSQGGQDGQNCMGCHPHDGNFSASGGTCTACHATARTSEYGRGGVAQIVGAGGEFANTQVSRHTAADPTDDDCAACHFCETSHPVDAMNLRDVDAVDTENTADKDVYCLKCHDGSAPTNIVDYSYINTAPYDKSAYSGNLHDQSATNSCALCHNRHGSANTNLLTQATNYDVCRTCHDGTGVAPKSSIDINTADRAIPGTSGTSHQWDVSASSGLYETNAPTVTAPGPTMSARLSSGNIVCSTCHDPHDNTNSSFLVADNSADEMCKDCHSARNIARYQDNVANKGSHPVGVAYTGTGSVKATPTGSVVTVGGNVECSSCHMTHNATTTDGNLLRQTFNNTLCTDCHTYSTHNGQNCLDCHDTHNADKTNIYMVKSTITTPNSGDKSVVFTAQTGAGSYVDTDGTYDGVCEVCHTLTTHHLNDGSGITHDDATDKRETNCVSCHSHSDNFGTPNCVSCHQSNFPTWNISDNHVTHNTDMGYDCSICHSGNNHDDGTVDVNLGGIADDGGTPTFNSTTKACSNVYCHSDSYQAYASPDPVWTDVGSINSCTPCHGVDANSVAPATGAHAKHTGTLYSHFECGDCHNVLPSAAYLQTTHADGTKDFSLSISGLATRDGQNAITPSYNTTTNVCSNVYCHSNGVSADRGSEGVANWGLVPSTENVYVASPSWKTGSITACNSCHEGPSTMPAAPNYTIQEGNNTGLVTASGQYPNTGAHGSNTGAHNSPDQLIVLTEDATYGDALSHSWPFVQCFWCHNNDAGAASGEVKYQGTYGTTRHVDGKTWFYPSWYGYGGMGEKTSGGQAPAYYTMDTEAEIIGLGNGYVWHPDPVDVELKGSMIPGLAYAWMGPTNEHCGNGKNCW